MKQTVIKSKAKTLKVAEQSTKEVLKMLSAAQTIVEKQDNIESITIKNSIYTLIIKQNKP